MAAIVGAIAAYANGDLSLIQCGEAIIAALMGATIRAGVSKIGQ